MDVVDVWARIAAVEPTVGDEKTQLRTLVRVSTEAQRVLEGVPSGTAFTLGVEVGADGTMSGVRLPAEFAAAARAAGLQIRVQLVVDGYDKREVDLAAIHGVRDDDLQRLADALDMKTGDRVLDLGCGYGEVSQNVLAAADRAGTTIELTMCDLHEVQTHRIPDAVRARAADLVIADARSLPFDDGHFDSVVMKMALHEVPIYDQSIVATEALRVLRPGGVFVVWGVMPQDGEAQDVFIMIMRLKNQLAGYESLIDDRYFFRLDQLLALLSEAGFDAVREVHRVHFRQSTLARCNSELGGSKDKLAQLNEYCRALISPALATAMDLTDTGDDIQFSVANHIVSARRPN